MLLTIDIGNTNIVLGVFKGDCLIADWRVATLDHLTRDDVATFLEAFFHLRRLQFSDIEAVIISSVVPPLNEAFQEACRAYLKVEPLMVEPGIRTGMAIEYEDPREVGADRIVNAVAAFERVGGPVIIVDFGTATTVDVVSAEGHYLGGAIAPGIVISMDALFQHASRLPRVDLVKPPSAIGRNTVNSMQAGIIFGYVGLVKELIRRCQEELHELNPKSPPAQVVATGGLARLLGDEISEITLVEPLLTLQGLRLIYERNSSESQRRRSPG